MNKQEEEEFQELLDGVDKFAASLKARLKEKHLDGYNGWKNVSKEHSAYQVQKVSTELILNPSKDIDVANWCLINYLNRNRL